jgi:hypothetical protein
MLALSGSSQLHLLTITDRLKAIHFKAAVEFTAQ